ncbi:MAG: hypothetical protein JWN33_359 [Candidatus Saccharibacteria bacterium]|nr:hypothetical protein [Candidatus Saccharibacteria bacterium]
MDLAYYTVMVMLAYSAPGAVLGTIWIWRDRKSEERYALEVMLVSLIAWWMMLRWQAKARRG